VKTDVVPRHGAAKRESNLTLAYVTAPVVAVVGSVPCLEALNGTGATLLVCRSADELHQLLDRESIRAVIWEQGVGVPVVAVVQAFKGGAVPLLLVVDANAEGLAALIACAKHAGPMYVTIRGFDGLARALDFALAHPFSMSPVNLMAMRLIPAVPVPLQPVVLAALSCAPWRLSMPAFERACGYDCHGRTLRDRLRRAGWPQPSRLVALVLGVYTAFWSEHHAIPFRGLAHLGGWQGGGAFRDHLRHYTGKSPQEWKRMGFDRALTHLESVLRSPHGVEAAGSPR
jgi:hypothetical protein